MNKLSKANVNTKNVNAFTFMMGNRHKQDEIINEIIEKEKETKAVEDTYSGLSVKLSSSVLSNCKEDEEIVECSSLRIFSPKKLNAFQFLMSNPSKKKEDEEKESNPVHEEIKKRKESRLIVQSSSEDSDEGGDADNIDQSTKITAIDAEEKIRSANQSLSPKEEVKSPPNLKLDLINEIEEFDIEETFKEEILECVSKKPKKNKRRDKHKLSLMKKNQDPNLNNNIQSETDVDLNLKSSPTELFKSNQPSKASDETDCNLNTIKKISHQPDIKSFFKSLNSKGEKIGKDLIVEESPSSKMGDSKRTCKEKETLKQETKAEDINQEKCNSTPPVKASQNCVKGNRKLKVKRKTIDSVFVSNENSSETYCNEDNKKSIAKANGNTDQKNKLFLKKNLKVVSNKDNIENESKGSTNVNKNNKIFTNKNVKVFSNEDNIKIEAKRKSRVNKENNSKLVSDDDNMKIETQEESKVDNENSLKVISNESNIDNEATVDKEIPLIEYKLRRSCRSIKKTSFSDFFTDFPKENKKNVSEYDEVTRNSDEDFKTSKKKVVENSKPVKLKNSKETKKKKKRKESSSSNQPLSPIQSTKEENSDTNDESDTSVILLDESPEIVVVKKMAPIFMKKKAVVLSPTKLKARSDFLFSVIPDTLKKIASKSEDQITLCPFPKYSHVKQVGSELSWNLPDPHISLLSQADTSAPILPPNSFLALKQAPRKHSTLPHQDPLMPFPSLNATTVCHILAYLKSKDNTFPAVSVFNAFILSKEEYFRGYKKECAKEELHKAVVAKVDPPIIAESSPVAGRKLKRKKKGRYSGCNKRRRVSQDTKVEVREGTEEVPIWHRWIPYDWTHVFAPTSSEFVIGNNGPVTHLKSWLSHWKNKSETPSVLKLARKALSEDNSDTNDSEASIVNAMLVTGPPGSGKTASVYAVAQDFGFHVLEVNGSSSRQGKAVMSQLSEATQSHNVSSSNAQQQLHTASSVDEILVDSSEQVDKTKKMTLILIEDIDIVFEDADDGFLSALNTLMSTSKRPIIMTTSINAVSVTSKIKEQYMEIELASPSPKLIAQHLQLMCLANGVFVGSKEIEILIRSNSQDVRRSILDLQFWILSGTCQVQWWKKDGANVCSTLKLSSSHPDMSLQKLFPQAAEVSSKSVEIPISAGCIWGKADAQLLKEGQYHHPARESERPLDWALVSANSSSLLPFEKKETRREEKYPLKKNNPLLKARDWLSIHSGSESESEATPNVAPPQDSKKVTLSEEGKRANRECLESLAQYLGAFTDLDILSCRERTWEPLHGADGWWAPPVLPGLEGVLGDRLPTRFDLSLKADLIPEISRLSLKRAQEGILRATSSLGAEEETSPLRVDVLQQGMPILLQAHAFLSQDEKRQQRDLNVSLGAILTSLSDVNRGCVVSDYLPFLRDMARSDLNSESLRQYRRGRRFYKYFRYLGFPEEIPQPKLIKICNVFQRV